MRTLALFLLCTPLLLTGCSSQQATPTGLEQAAPQELVSSPHWDESVSDTDIDGIQTISAGLSPTDQRCQLELRKHGKMLDVLLSTDELVDASGSVVRWKVDDDKIHAEHWSTATDLQGLFSPNPYEFLLAISHAHSLTLEYTPVLYGPITLRYSLPAALPDEFQRFTAKALSVVAQKDKEARRLKYQSEYRDCENRHSYTDKNYAECQAILKESGYSLIDLFQ